MGSAGIPSYFFTGEQKYLY